MTAVDTDAPRWDVSEFFPGLESREFTDAEERLGAQIDRLRALYDQHDVRGGDRTLDAASVAAFEEVLDATNAVIETNDLIEAYVYAFVSTDTDDATAQAALSRIEQQGATLASLRTRLDAWTTALGAEDLIAASEAAAAHAWPVQKAATRAAHQMSEAEEDLANVMGLTGSSAWYRLWSDVTSAITTTVDLPSGAEDKPIFAVRGLATDPDPAVRSAAYDAEIGAWAANRIPLAAAMNAVKGEQQALALRRGWDSVLDAHVFGQAIDRDTLDAMQSAMVASFPDFRRYLRAKARALGHTNGLPFWDLFAPMGQVVTRTWDEAVAAVNEAFSSYSPQLRALADRAVAEQWLDVAPRAGKQGGAFCMPIGEGTSRVLLNFDGSVNGFMTLAHELGHAYHNSAMAGRTPIQKGTPSSLAETASIFCETIMVNHTLSTSTDPDEQLAMLEVDLMGATQVVVDIHSRFLFESAVFDERRKGSLSPDRLCELMVDAQLATYGDALDPEVLHPWMWAAKPHYYGSVFYNYPYAFGLLFGMGLYARYEEDADGFRAGYDDLLSSTGLGTAADLANRFGIDIRDEAFWTSSLDVIRGRVDTFCDLVDP